MNVLHGVGGLLGIANAFGNDEPDGGSVRTIERAESVDPLGADRLDELGIVRRRRRPGWSRLP
jgi:hypothetical protein